MVEFVSLPTLACGDLVGQTICCATVESLQCVERREVGHTDQGTLADKSHDDVGQILVWPTTNHQPPTTKTVLSQRPGRPVSGRFQGTSAIVCFYLVANFWGTTARVSYSCHSSLSILHFTDIFSTLRAELAKYSVLEGPALRCVSYFSLVRPPIVR